MEDKWDFYFAKVDGNLGSIFVNLTLDDHAPVARYGHVVVLRLTMQDPRPDGLSSAEEFDTLADIDNALYENVCRQQNAIYVGRVTYAGTRDFYFYVADADAAAKGAARAMKAFAAYKFELLSQPDAEWNTFRNFLLPSAADRQRMGNRNTADQLRESGDPLTEAREIDHWAYFPASALRDDFVSKAIAAGYTLRAAAEPDPATDGTAYGAQIFRADVPGTDMFDAITIELSKLARECGGDYDGWESPVRMPESQN